MRYGTNDQMSPRIYPWWLILVGFVFGVIVTLVVTASRPQQVMVYQPYEVQDFSLTATGIVREATLNAQVFNNQMAFPTEIDPMSATAAALNAQIGLGDRLSTGDDPIFLTATAIVIQATPLAPPQKSGKHNKSH
jgi:hypothetical protein